MKHAAHLQVTLDVPWLLRRKMKQPGSPQDGEGCVQVVAGKNGTKCPHEMSRVGLAQSLRRRRGGPLEVLTSDLAVYILEMLDDEVLVGCMSVCKKWMHLGGAREIWQVRNERSEDGTVNWNAFQRFNDLRQKAHSKVVQCRSRTSGKYLVVKRISTRVNPTTGEAQDVSQDQGFPVRYLREVSLLRASTHPNVMRLYFVNHQEGSLDLFSEFVGQNMEDYLAHLPTQCFEPGTDDHGWAMKNCKSYMQQIISAVCYCHSRGILMRDIKPRNVMLDHTGSGQVKLTGFALGRFASLPAEPLTREVVTLSYRAPEILLGGQNPVYSSPVDMWSVGCTFAEMASGKTLFEGESEIGLLFDIFRLLGTPNDGMWPGVASLPDFLADPPQWRPKDLSTKAPLCVAGLDLLASLLRYDPAQRISAKQALSHPFFTGDTPGGSAPEKAQGASGDQLCCEYWEELRERLLSLENGCLPAEVCETDRHLKGFAAMRKILVEWLVEVVEEARMKCETLFLSVNYMDRLLAMTNIAREKLQLVGITSILVASKHEELAPQSVQNLVIMTDNT